MIDKRFTNLYPVSKTLKFELKPIGKTLENIEKNDILERDEERATAYKNVKKIIDEFHKRYIEQKLSDFKLEQKQLEEYYMLYHLPNTDAKQRTELPKIEEILRKQISERFTKDEYYKRLFGKELIREDLAEFVNTLYYENIIRNESKNKQLTDSEIEQIKEKRLQEIAQFNDFTIYFTGYHDTRKNMYVAEEKATSIAHRMINENLPKFIDNMDVFEKVAESV